MAKICPMNSCKEHEGMCMHDKLMIGMIAIALIAVIAKFSGVF